MTHGHFCIVQSCDDKWRMVLKLLQGSFNWLQQSQLDTDASVGSTYANETIRRSFYIGVSNAPTSSDDPDGTQSHERLGALRHSRFRPRGASASTQRVELLGVALNVA